MRAVEICYSSYGVANHAIKRVEGNAYSNAYPLCGVQRGRRSKFLTMKSAIGVTCKKCLKIIKKQKKS